MVNLGAPELGIVSLILLLTIIPIVLGIVTAIDASRIPDTQFDRASTSKTLWIVLPLVGIVTCGLISIVAAIVWFTSTKSRVLAASGER